MSSISKKKKQQKKLLLYSKTIAECNNFIKRRENMNSIKPKKI